MSKTDDEKWAAMKAESEKLFKKQSEEFEKFNKEIQNKKERDTVAYDMALQAVESGRLSKEDAEENYQVKLKDLSVKHTGFYVRGKKSIQPDYYEWAKYFIQERRFFTYEGGYYIYDETKKHYRRIQEDEIDYQLTIDTKHKVKPEHRNNFIRTLTASNFRTLEELEATNGLLNLNNGVLNIRTREFSPHDGSQFFTYCLPHEFNKDARCDKWMKFLNEVFKGSEEMMAVSAQIFGYIMLGGHPWLHKAFVLYGEGRNGKSTFLEILKVLLGHRNFTSVSLSDLDKSFSRVRLDDTLANIIEETPNDKINAEIFKTAIGGGHLLGAEKYKNEYTFQCNARFIFACNELPKFSENSVGLQERLYFMPFNTYFEKGKRNGNILNELTEELPGILNWALSGLDMLLENRYIPDCAASQTIFEQYQLEADSVYSWANENVKIDKDMLFVKSKDLYAKYRHDLSDTGRRPVSDMVFYRRFKKYVREKIPKAEECRDKLQEHRGYSGLSYCGQSLAFSLQRQ